jgi:hypothetical protein
MNSITLSELVTLIDQAGSALDISYEMSLVPEVWDISKQTGTPEFEARRESAYAIRSIGRAFSLNAGKIGKFLLTLTASKDSMDVRILVQQDISALFKLSAQLFSVTNTSVWRIRFLQGMEILSYYRSLAPVA